MRTNCEPGGETEENMSKIMDRMKELEAEYIEIRRAIHRHPETAFEEKETTALVVRELERCGIEVFRNGEDTGAVGVLRGALPGKTVALRADIDALPMQEETGLPFASEIPGRCHACGHDIHTAALLAAARLLSEHREQLRGTVKFFFQPAEEKLGGAKSLIAHGFLDDADAIFGAHTWPDVPGGSVGIKRGAAMAGSDTFRITITAPGGHAAHPHKTPDPIAAAAYMITQIQTIVARELNPLDSAVITVGEMTAGTAANIIPSEVVLEGSMRYLLPAVRTQIHDSLRRIAEGTGTALRVKTAVEIIPGCGPVIGADELVSMAEASAARLLGENKVEILPSASMGSEDFAFYLEKKPGAFFRIGTGGESAESRLPLHNNRLIFNEAAIAAGAVTFCGIVFLFTGSDLSALE